LLTEKLGITSIQNPGRGTVALSSNIFKKSNSLEDKKWVEEGQRV
jgi:hypothetical protein